MCLPRSLPPALRPSSPPLSPPLLSRPHRRNASGKANEAKKKDPSKVKGTNDGGEAKMDKELVLYEFINLLVRIAFSIGSRPKPPHHSPRSSALHRSASRSSAPIRRTATLATSARSSRRPAASRR